MNVIAIVQARIGGRRFPGKVLVELGHHLVLQHVLRRVQAAIPTTILAVPDTTENHVLYPWGGPTFLGSEDDVLQRYFDAALPHNADIIVRVTADCPFVDPTLISRVAAAATARQHYVRTDPRLPRGLDVEAFTMRELAAALECATGSDREHVCPWMARRIVIPHCVNVGYPLPQDGEPRLRWTLDTPADLKWFQAVAQAIDVTPPLHPTVHELLALLARRPDLRRTEDDYARETPAADSR